MTLYSYSMPRLYSDAEAADRLAISVATVRRLRVRGELGHLAIGRRVFVTEDQLKELLRRGRRESNACINDAASDGQAKSGTTSPYSAGRSRPNPMFDQTSDDLKQAYEKAEGGSIGPETAEIMAMFGVSQYLNSSPKPKRR